MTSNSAGYAERILEQLLRLRALDAVKFEESGDPEGLHRHRFRSGGWQCEIDVDMTVLELRAYQGNDVVATARIPENIANMLIGKKPVPREVATGASASEACAALRAVIGDWRSKNARVRISSPNVARHPDGWNNS